MPWMPDEEGKNGGADTQSVTVISREPDIKAVEKRILSSTEHLNEILGLLALLTVFRHRSFGMLTGRRKT